MARGLYRWNIIAALTPKSARVRMDMILVKTALMPAYSTPSVDMKMRCVMNPNIATTALRIIPLAAVLAEAIFLLTKVLYHHIVL